MSTPEIVLPETKPETEWIRGRAQQKMSPKYLHAAVQKLLLRALDDWAETAQRGRVGAEWRFRVAPPGQAVRPLVPDVAFLSFQALPPDAPAGSVAVPLGAPTLAIEILSPGDNPSDIADKIATYLAAGTDLVAVVDPENERIVLHDGSMPTRELHSDNVFDHPSLPEFQLDIGMLFRRAKRYAGS